MRAPQWERKGLALNGEFQEFARKQVEDSIAAKQSLLADADLLRDLERVGRAVVQSLQSGGKVLVFGNGGSAADAQHIAAELVGRYKLERPGLPALALTVNTSVLTAVGNDYSFDQVFARQVQALGVRGDVAIGISTSGNSANVALALQAARSRGMVTVGMTGSSGGKLKSQADFCLRVPSEQTPRIQECHILLAHIVCDFVEAELFGAKP
jgi:D-sedoheptulose 7-phosphate isomerase